MSGFTWVEPQWEKERELERLDPDYVGNWPFCYDPFLAAVRFKTAGDDDYHWEYYVLIWAETGLEYAWTGEAWDIAGPDDIEWIAKIPGPTTTQPGGG